MFVVSCVFQLTECLRMCTFELLLGLELLIVCLSFLWMWHPRARACINLYIQFVYACVFTFTHRCTHACMHAKELTHTCIYIYYVHKLTRYIYIYRDLRALRVLRVWTEFREHEARGDIPVFREFRDLWARREDPDLLVRHICVNMMTDACIYIWMDINTCTSRALRKCMLYPYSSGICTYICIYSYMNRIHMHILIHDVCACLGSSWTNISIWIHTCECVLTHTADLFVHFRSSWTAGWCGTYWTAWWVFACV